MAAASPPLSSPMSPIDQSPWNPASRRNQSMDYDMFNDTELAQVRTQLQRFVSQHEDSSSQDFTEGSKAITRLHWINPSKRSRCQNSSCKAKFILKLRKHHCRKCGEVFCARCLSFQRKLSPTAEYDPNGKLFMVCSKCFNSETQGPGQARIWTQTFLEMRRDSLLAHAEAIGETTQKPSRAHLEKECQRLVEGFSMNLTDLPPSQEVRLPQSEGTGKNILMRKLSALKNHVSKVPGLVKIGPPEWKKPITWISAGANCQFCSTAFTMTYKKHNCYICGRLACFSCSVKDLLLYVPDKDDQEHVGKLARWAIIKVIGSPELEPDIRHYVRVCTVCRQALEVVQVENYEASIKGEESEDCLKQMKDLFDNIIKFQDKIDAWLPKYKQLIDALEIAGESPKVLPASRSNMQTLAKHQGDLTDYFTSFVVAVSRLKKLKPQTNKQLKLVKALMRCKFNYYNDNMYTFRKLKRRLEQISPPEVLQAIQSIVDSQSINSTCLSIGQLSYESLHICLKYELSEELPAVIKDTYEVCQKDLKQIIEEQGQETWEERQNQITAFIKIQLKGHEDFTPCLYIRPSQRNIQRFGPKYVNSFLYSRCDDIIGKVVLQLHTRSADRKFQKSKESLASLRRTVRELKVVTQKGLEFR
ncbi:uncharacterized protein [Asterias amurensis]|uniref:uncharacterized protein n=1 Tax=Asterias amurensis TaxID=7602 RepID=UPI003AB5B58E